MSDDPNSTLDALRLRERSLELEAVDVRARVAEVRSLIEMLENPPRRRPGRPRNASALNPVPSQHADLQQALDIMPQRVEGAAHEPETQETAA